MIGGQCRILLTVSSALYLLLLSACAAVRPVVPYPPGIMPPRSVAVLPLDNKTDSVSGARFLREEMQENLKEKGYVGTPLSDVDQLLADHFGISHGGEISESIISDIGKVLKVDAVITGTVQKFGVSWSGFPTNEVKATFALYETGTGTKLWKYDGYASNLLPLFSAEALGRQLGAYSAGRPLPNEVSIFYEKLLAEMPNGAESYKKVNKP